MYYVNTILCVTQEEGSGESKGTLWAWLNDKFCDLKAYIKEKKLKICQIFNADIKKVT